MKEKKNTPIVKETEIKETQIWFNTINDILKNKDGLCTLSYTLSFKKQISHAVQNVFLKEFSRFLEGIHISNVWDYQWKREDCNIILLTDE